MKRVFEYRLIIWLVLLFSFILLPSIANAYATCTNNWQGGACLWGCKGTAKQKEEDRIKWNAQPFWKRLGLGTCYMVMIALLIPIALILSIGDRLIDNV